jgi:hypothetical protein
MANALLLGQASRLGDAQGVGVLADARAQGQNMAAQRQQMGQQNALFQQQQEDRQLGQELAPIENDISRFLTLDEAGRENAWHSGFASHYGIDPAQVPYKQALYEVMGKEPRLFSSNPKIKQAIFEKEFGLSTAQAPSSVQEYEFFNKLPPDGKQQFMTLRRASKTIDLGDSQAVLSPDGRISQQYQKQAPPQDQPEFKQQQAEASARGKALGEVEEKMPALDSFGIAKKAMLDSIGKTSTGGPLGAKGRAGAVTEYQAQRQFEQRKQQLSTEIRTVFRIPGEGTLTDQEQKQYGIQLPDVLNDPEINGQIMTELEARVMARMRQPQPEQAPAAQQPTAKRRYNPQTGKIE